MVTKFHHLHTPDLTLDHLARPGLGVLAQVNSLVQQATFDALYFSEHAIIFLWFFSRLSWFWFPIHRESQLKISDNNYDGSPMSQVCSAPPHNRGTSTRSWVSYKYKFCLKRRFWEKTEGKWISNTAHLHIPEGEWTRNTAHLHILLLHKLLPQFPVLHFKQLLAIWCHYADILITKDIQQFFR